MNLLSNFRYNTGGSYTSSKFEELDQDFKDNKNLSGQDLDIPYKEIPASQFWDKVYSRNNKVLYLGFNYQNRVLRKSLSGMFWIEGKRENILIQFDRILTEMIEMIKHVKKTFNYILDKKYREFN